MPRVYVIGSINMDLVVRTASLPRPGETVAGLDFATHPGGKGANQAVAAARLGADVAMVGKVGDDAFGGELCAFLASNGVDVARVRTTGECPTGVATITVDGVGENVIVVVPGANAEVRPDDLDVDPGPDDVVVAPFEIPLETIAEVFARARRTGARTVLNPAPARPCESSLIDLADVLIVNETELAFFAGLAEVDPADSAEVVRAIGRVRTRSDQVVVATLGPRGAIASVGGEEVEVTGRRVEVVDTTAAGDTFTGAVAARIAEGWDVPRALGFANAAASLCVGRAGAGPSIPTRAEVETI